MKKIWYLGFAAITVIMLNDKMCFAIDNVLDVSPEGGSFYTAVSSAIADIPTSGNDVPSLLNPWLIRVFPGTYNDYFTIPSYVRVQGMGWTPYPAGGTTKIYSSSHHPVVTMQDKSAMDNMVIFGGEGYGPTTGTLISTTSGGGSHADITNCMAACLGTKTLIGISLNGYNDFVLDSDVDNCGVGISVTDFGLGGILKRIKVEQCDNGIYVESGSVQIHASDINCAEKISINAGGDGARIATTRLVGTIINNSTVKLVHCYDENFDPITNQ